jgi:hypothetical protein
MVVLLLGRVFTYVGCAWCEWGEPVNLGPNVNNNGFQYYPSISADETTLYFADPNRPGGYGSDDIWVSTWDGVEWSLPVNVGPNVNTDRAEISPSISADGSKLYFVCYGSPGGYGTWDVWISSWEGTMWGPPVNAGPNVNTPYMEFTASISFDGKELYFSSDRPGTLGDSDLWVSEWDSMNAEWGPAENLGPNVNTANREYCSSVSSDGTQLYFARWLGISHPDIFVSEWQDTTWGPAVNLGAPINTTTWDDGPSISEDGTKLYFASSRDTSRPAIQDIWVSEWMPGVEEWEGTDNACTARILQNHPNPLHHSTLFSYSLPQTTQVTLSIYDISGRLVETLVNETQQPGIHQVRWDRESNPSSVYFYSLRAGEFVETRKMVVVE